MENPTFDLPLKNPSPESEVREVRSAETALRPRRNGPGESFTAPNRRVETPPSGTSRSCPFGSKGFFFETKTGASLKKRRRSFPQLFGGEPIAALASSLRHLPEELQRRFPLCRLAVEPSLLSFPRIGGLELDLYQPVP